MDGAADLPLWTDYVAALTPAGAFVAALLAVVVAWRAHVLQKRAERHQDLWESLTWAVEQLTDPDDDFRTQLGLSVLARLGEDPLINSADNRLLQRVNVIVAARRMQRGGDRKAAEKGDMGIQEQPSSAGPWSAENTGSPGGTVFSRVAGHDLPYRTDDERRILERSNDLQEVIDRNAARLNRRGASRR